MEQRGAERSFPGNSFYSCFWNHLKNQKNQKWIHSCLMSDVEGRRNGSNDDRVSFDGSAGFRNWCRDVGWRIWRGVSQSEKGERNNKISKTQLKIHDDHQEDDQASRVASWCGRGQWVLKAASLLIFVSFPLTSDSELLSSPTSSCRNFVSKTHSLLLHFQLFIHSWLPLKLNYNSSFGNTWLTEETWYSLNILFSFSGFHIIFFTPLFPPWSSPVVELPPFFWSKP